VISELDVFFDTNDLAVDAIYQRGTVTRFIVIIFDREYTPTTLGDIEVQMTVPKALAKSADIEGIDETATMTVAGVVYKVAEVHPDAQGFSEVILTKD
jgi:hypothetical protein